MCCSCTVFMVTLTQCHAIYALMLDSKQHEHGLGRIQPDDVV